nr:PREDICTED: guanine nucleotide-binding protein G(o) subunit alpha-like isoform X2 [Struthio camelus australis]
MRRGWEVAYRLELEKQASGAVWVEGLPAFSRCAGESGKSTIVKQMRILHVNGFNAEIVCYCMLPLLSPPSGASKTEQDRR